MKKIKSVEKIILLFVVFAFICGISTINYASGDVNDIMNIPYINGNSTQNPTPAPTTPDNNNAANIPTNNAVDNNATTNTTSNISAVQNQNTNSTSLPKTGVNDTAMWILVIACVVVAIYTYKKVRDYNV